MMPRAGQIWRHYKGDDYKVVALAQHTEIEEYLVVYVSCKDESKVWVRPLVVWLERVEIEEGKRMARFTYQFPKDGIINEIDRHAELGLRAP